MDWKNAFNISDYYGIKNITIDLSQFLLMH